MASQDFDDETLMAYADGELDAEDAAEVEALLSVDADAREAVERTIADALANDPEMAGASAEIEWRGFQAEGAEMDPGHPMMDLLSRLHHEVTGDRIEPLASTATTDARFFQLYGDTPATCYGPEADAIHGIDESVSLDSMMQVATVLALFMAEWCGLEANPGDARNDQENVP